jgi:ubiquinone/menaquinone biosynthesis C-methylase UbiE
MTNTDFWNKIAPKYATQPIRDPEAYQYTLGRTQSYLRATDHVLELGCGTGSTALLLAPLVARYTATDISEQMIDIGKTKAQEQNAGNLDFKAADWADAQLLDRDYDVVLALNLLHLLEDLPNVLRRIHALLPEGGYFISKTTVAPDQGAPLGYWAIRAVLPLLQLARRAPFVAFRKAPDLDRMIESAGFEIIETTNAPARPPNRYIVARKR